MSDRLPFLSSIPPPPTSLSKFTGTPDFHARHVSGKFARRVFVWFCQISGFPDFSVWQFSVWQFLRFSENVYLRVSNHIYIIYITVISRKIYLCHFIILSVTYVSILKLNTEYSTNIIHLVITHIMDLGHLASNRCKTRSSRRTVPSFHFLSFR